MDKYGTAPSMDRKQKRGRQGLGEEVGSYFAGTEFQFCKMTGVPWTGGGDGRVATCVSLPPLDCTLKNGYDDKFSVTCVLPQFKKKGTEDDPIRSNTPRSQTRRQRLRKGEAFALGHVVTGATGLGLTPRSPSRHSFLTLPHPQNAHPVVL